MRALSQINQKCLRAKSGDDAIIWARTHGRHSTDFSGKRNRESLFDKSRAIPPFIGMGWGKRITEARTEAGLSQTKLGTLVGCAQQTISNWELEECSPTPDQFRKVARTLDVLPAWLVFDVPPKRPGQHLTPGAPLTRTDLAKVITATAQLLKHQGLPLSGLPPEQQADWILRTYDSALLLGGVERLIDALNALSNNPKKL